MELLGQLYYTKLFSRVVVLFYIIYIMKMIICKRCSRNVIVKRRQVSVLTYPNIQYTAQKKAPYQTIPAIFLSLLGIPFKTIG